MGPQIARIAALESMSQALSPKLRGRHRQLRERGAKQSGEQGIPPSLSAPHPPRPTLTVSSSASVLIA